MTNARKTTYRGTPMRSRLEAGFARWCDTNDIAWRYEPQAFGDSTGQYLPDFALYGVKTPLGERTVYVECKPGPYDYEHEKHRMEVVWASEPRAVCVIDSAGEPWVNVGVYALDESVRWGESWWWRYQCCRLTYLTQQEERACPRCGLVGLHLRVSPWAIPYWEVA